MRQYRFGLSNYRRNAARDIPSTDCEKCAEAFASGAKFCPECGSSTLKSCSKCGLTLLLSVKFCPKCGTSVAPASQAHEENSPLPETYTESRVSGAEGVEAGMAIANRETETRLSDMPAAYDPKEWGRASRSHPTWLIVVAVVGCAIVAVLWFNEIRGHGNPTDDTSSNSPARQSTPQASLAPQHVPTQTNSPSAPYDPKNILQVHAQQLIDDYFSDEEQANLKYKGKIVSVQGVLAKPPKLLDARCSSFSYGEIPSCKGGVGIVDSVDTDSGQKSGRNVVVVIWASYDDYLKGLRLHQYEAVAIKCPVDDPDPMELSREENTVKQRMLANGNTPEADDFSFHTILLSNCTL